MKSINNVAVRLKALLKGSVPSFDFLILSLILFFVSLPYLASTVWFAGDTMGLYELFYFFYNEFYWFGEIPRWVPFGFFGLPFDNFQTAFAPSTYVVTLIGSLLRVKDTLLLFKLSILLDQWILLGGSFFLAREAGWRRSASWFFCLGMMLSTVWLFQIFLNFRIYYLMPLVLALLIRSRREHDARCLWIAGTLAVLQLPGNAPYFAPLYLAVFLIFCALISPGSGSWPWKALKPRRGYLVWQLLFLTVTAMVLSFMAGVFEGTVSLMGDRDPVTKTTPIATFLSYGGNIGLKKFMGLFYGGPVPGRVLLDPSNLGAPSYTGDHALYTGLLPLALMLFGVLYARSRTFWAFFSVLLFLFCFSLADVSFVARTSYHLFPMMPLYRHIGLVHGLIRLFLLGGAVCGWHRYVSMRENPSESGSARHSLFACGAVVLAVSLFLRLKLNPEGDLYPEAWPAYLTWAQGLLGTMLVLQWLFTKISVRILTGAVLVFFLLDLGGHAWLLVRTAPRWPENRAAAAQVHAYRTEDVQRRSDNLKAHPRRAMSFMLAAGAPVAHTAAYGFIQMDPCHSRFRLDFVGERVLDLIRARGGEPPDKMPAPGDPFYELSGCESAKLKIFRSAYYADNKEEAVQMIRQTPEAALVIESVPAGERFLHEGSLESSPEDRVELVSFSSNRIELTAATKAPGGAWVVVADAWHPGWQVSVEGVSGGLYPANLAFRAFRIPEGEHRVVLRFGSGQQALRARLMDVLVTLTGFILLLWLLRLACPFVTGRLRKEETA